MEKLCNNILLPDDFASKPSDPRNVPYLNSPPEVINVTVGRQLFVDDFLIGSTDLSPEYHKARKFEGNPVLFPETDWEKEGSPVACPKSGAVLYDEKERLFKMWYEAGWLRQMCYAYSHDGINWIRPDLGLEPGTNKIMLFNHAKGSKENNPAQYLRPDSTTFFIDDNDPDPNRRYKMYLRNPGGFYPGIIGTSPDGVHWENLTLTTNVGDRSTAFYNPFRKKWVYSIRSGWKDRSRQYHECDDLFEGRHWNPDAAPKWLATDELDLSDPYIGMPPQLYNVDCAGYESIMLGMFEIHKGPENNFCGDRGVPKITELEAMYSRDGYNFSRPDRDPIINASRYKGAWDRGYVQSVGGITIINGDELWIYYIGFGGDERFDRSYSADDNQTGMYKNGATGIAKLRRDGFVSMNGKGSLLTRKLEFSGKESMSVNCKGSVRVTLIDGENQLADAYFSGDSTNARLDFGGFEVKTLEGRPFRVRFDLDGELYSFGFADRNGDFGGAHAGGVVR